MSFLQLANILQLLSVVLMATVVIHLYRELLTDQLRQKLFEVRDEAFDFAEAGDIDFSNEAYVLLRRELNGLIRFSHHLTVYRMIMSACIAALAQVDEERPWANQWKNSLESIQDGRVRRTMEGYYDRAIMLAMRHIFYASPILWPLVPIACVGLLFAGMWVGIRQLIWSSVKLLLRGPLDRERWQEDAAAFCS